MLTVNKAIFEAMGEALLSLSSGRVVYSNERAARLLGVDSAELADADLWDVLPGWRGGPLYRALEKTRHQRSNEHAPKDVEQFHATEERWLSLRIVPDGAQTYLFFTDVTDEKRAKQAREQLHLSIKDQLKTRESELERLNQQLLHDSLHDALTALPNRTYLLDALRRALNSASGGTYSLLLLDFDAFKLINDSLGHGVGDELLIALAKRLRNDLRATEMLARTGGDAFAILLSEPSRLRELERLVERLIGRLSQPVRVRDYCLYVSASVGVVHGLGDYDQAEDVLRDAEIAMYRAKRSGKGEYTLFDKRLRDEVMDRMVLESELRFAVEREQLRVQFQPIISLASLRPVGFESLVRWQHPVKGLVLPNDFVPIAEDSGDITGIDMWVVAEACRRMSRWSDAANAPLKLNVNFSGRHFARPNVPEQLSSVFERTGVRAGQLNVEITETVLMDNTVHTQKTLSELLELGVGVHIDDFGTGYSSLSYLQQFPAHCLKIDRSFTSRLGHKKGVDLVRSLITMAHSLDMTVTTEGIETKEQLEIIRNLGSDFAQGYYFSRPLVPDAVPAYLLEHSK